MTEEKKEKQRYICPLFQMVALLKDDIDLDTFCLGNICQWWNVFRWDDDGVPSDGECAINQLNDIKNINP